MNPALWGLITAVSWGSADFIARFTGRGLGVPVALFGMLVVSTVVFGVVVGVRDAALVVDPSGLGLIAAFGLGAMVATGLLYWCLSRGPVTVAAPLAGSYPVFNVMFAVARGSAPTGVQWAAMAAVIMGVVVVARSAANFEDSNGYDAADLKKVVAGSLLAALAFAVTVVAAQESGRIYGELQSVWMSRCVSLVAIAAVLTWRRETPRVPRRWWSLIVLQGLLDGGAYITLAASGAGSGGEIGAVVASAFCAVTVVLGRVILREAMTWAQWGGIVLIVAGVAMLSAQ